MNELYFTKTNRGIIQVVRLEYGQLGEKYVLKTFEGEENPNGLFLHKSIFPREEVFDADEIWISSSSKELAPVTHIDGQLVGDGKPGPVWEKAAKLYSAGKFNY